MATLAATFGGAKLAMGGGDKKADSSIPPLNAKSSDEEKYIKYAPFSIPTIPTIPTTLQ